MLPRFSCFGSLKGQPVSNYTKRRGPFPGEQSRQEEAGDKQRTSLGQHWPTCGCSCGLVKVQDQFG